MSDRDEDLMAVPRLAERVGVTPRVIRYWGEQGLISPTTEHGRLRYSPRDTAIARLIKRLLDAGYSVDGIRMLKSLAERGVRDAAGGGAEVVLAEIALQILYRRKAFREVTGREEEHYPEPPPPPPPHGGPRDPAHHRPGHPGPSPRPPRPA
jgi:DNA-binding transcriptional MerR regulator